MKRKIMRVRPAALPAFLLAGLIALATGCLPAFAATYTLRAEATIVTLPGDTTVPMWGFALVSYDLGAGLVEVNGPATVPGPRLTVPAGQGLTVHLLNTLPSPVSLYIPGQALPLAEGATEPQVTRNGQGRIQSFVHETPGGLPGAPCRPGGLHLEQHPSPAPTSTTAAPTPPSRCRWACTGR